MRRNGRYADSKVRDHVYKETVELVARWEANARHDGDVDFAEHVRRTWQPRIDALYEGRRVVIRRFNLPREHPLSPKYGGDPCDHFVLGPGDTLVPYEAPKLELNRAQRRAAGQRRNGWRR